MSFFLLSFGYCSPWCAIMFANNEFLYSFWLVRRNRQSVASDEFFYGDGHDQAMVSCCCYGSLGR